MKATRTRAVHNLRPTGADCIRPEGQDSQLRGTGGHASLLQRTGRGGFQDHRIRPLCHPSNGTSAFRRTDHPRTAATERACTFGTKPDHSANVWSQDVDNASQLRPDRVTHV
jgi:hypothetical protein